MLFCLAAAKIETLSSFPNPIQLFLKIISIIQYSFLKIKMLQEISNVKLMQRPYSLYLFISIFITYWSVILLQLAHKYCLKSVHEKRENAKMIYNTKKADRMICFFCVVFCLNGLIPFQFYKKQGLLLPNCE